jgi:hypothetical protein
MKKKLLFFLLGGDDGDKRAVFAAFVELDNTVNEGEKGMIFTHADVLAGVVGGTALTDDNVAGDAFLTTKDFHA